MGGAFAAARCCSVGGPSGPTLFAQVIAIRAKSVGPEGPPTDSARRA
ncbi:DUF6053 domain-containing protein [Lysobacter enzymogenes]